MNEPLSYGKAIAELESIVAKMQSDDCDIDSLAGYTTRALELLKFCKEKLFTTDQEVKKCLEALTPSV
ncbi:MAG: exodeoxyribonuclease VII small subunit [Muribaculaceae bacterium]|nr:exodeoxyribonuclease VII small subunit [Muribaculaceae bacterium]